MVSNTQNKNSENLDFYQILGINYAYDRYYIHAVWDGHFLGPLCVNGRCNFVNFYKQQHLSALFHCNHIFFSDSIKLTQ